MAAPGSFTCDETAGVLAVAVDQLGVYALLGHPSTLFADGFETGDTAR